MSNANKTGSPSKRDQFVAKLKDGLDTLNEEIDELEAKAASATESAKVKASAQMAEAKIARARMEAQINTLKDAGEDSWEDLKDDAEKTWKALRNSVNYFKSHFK